MNKHKLSSFVKAAYYDLLPFSKRYKVDYKRYVFTLQILAEKTDPQGKKILDIGTGIGIMPLALKKIGNDAYGLDYFIFPENKNEMFKNESIQELQTVWKNNNLKIINQNIFAESLPWPQETFDIIISEAMIEHLKDPKQFISKCFRMLKPNGLLLLSTPNPTSLLKRIRFLFGTTPNWPVNDFFNAGEKFTGHWREYTMKELKYMCQAIGFKITATHNKNLLADFKGFRQWKKNLHAFVSLVSNLLPGTREMNYIICQKQK